MALGPLLKSKDRTNLPLVQELVRAHLPVLGVWIAVLVPACGLFLLSSRRGRWPVAFAAILALVTTTTLVVSGVFQPEIAARRTFKPFLTAVRERLAEHDDLYFYETFDYGAVFYARRRIPTVGDDFGPPPTPGRGSYLLMWESVWNAVPAERKSSLELVGVSDGTGPKGRDRLTLVRVLKPQGSERRLVTSQPEDHEEE
jgi:hypothetical protein